MNFFTKKSTWTNWEFIPLKLSIASIYLMLGAMFWKEVKEYAGIIGIILGITLMISLYLWITKMKKEN